MERKKNIAIWRGGLTDIGMPNGNVVSHFTSCPRFILCKKSLSEPSEIDAGINWVDQAMEKALVEVCKDGLSQKDHLYGKYLPVLDGHMCTYPGYQWRLLSNSVCLKQKSNQIQWFYRVLKPYVHFIPIANDLEDLEEKISWAKEHDDEVQKITPQARKFAKENLLLEDNYFYLYLVLNRYAELQSTAEDEFRNTKKDPKWKCIQYHKRLSLYKSVYRLKKRLLNF